MMKELLLTLLIITIISGYYVYINNHKEGFVSIGNCPDVLIQDGKKIYLYNSKRAKVAGVNPIQFENLEEYVEFLDWQRHNGLRCPVLFLQKSYDAQGNSNFRIRPSPLNLQGGLNTTSTTANSSLLNDNQSSISTPSLLIDANKNDPPYNQNSYPDFDAHNQYIGVKTPLDDINQNIKGSNLSADAMSDNWGGPGFTQELVNEGYYKDNEVNIYIP